MRIAYFTAGTVGAGHLVRGLAIRRGLARAGFSGTYRMFGPALPFPVTRLQPDYEAVEIQTDRRLRDRHLAQTSDLGGRLLGFRPDLLLVDMFWSPLRWILPRLDAEAWLLVRTCPPHWLAGPADAPFDAAQYARILAIEPLSRPGLDAALDPIVIANPDECRPPGALRERLGVAAGEELVVVLHAGERGEVLDLREATTAGRPFVLDLFEESGNGALFPAAEWLSGADRVVSGAGYNAFWEARWLGYAERAMFVPFRRTIDDQALRLRDFWTYQPKENGADTLARWILHP